MLAIFSGFYIIKCLFFIVPLNLPLSLPKEITLYAAKCQEPIAFTYGRVRV